MNKNGEVMRAEDDEDSDEVGHDFAKFLKYFMKHSNTKTFPMIPKGLLERTKSNKKSGLLNRVRILLKF